MRKEKQSCQLKMDFTKPKVRVVSINNNIDKKLSSQILNMKRPISR